MRRGKGRRSGLERKRKNLVQLTLLSSFSPTKEMGDRPPGKSAIRLELTGKKEVL